jgi:hypothetical protein
MTRKQPQVVPTFGLIVLILDITRSRIVIRVVVIVILEAIVLGGNWVSSSLRYSQSTRAAHLIGPSLFEIIHIIFIHVGW